MVEAQQDLNKIWETLHGKDGHGERIKANEVNICHITETLTEVKKSVKDTITFWGAILLAATIIFNYI